MAPTPDFWVQFLYVTPVGKKAAWDVTVSATDAAHAIRAATDQFIARHVENLRVTEVAVKPVEDPEVGWRAELTASLWEIDGGGG